MFDDALDRSLLFRFLKASSCPERPGDLAVSKLEAKLHKSCLPCTIARSPTQTEMFLAAPGSLPLITRPFLLTLVLVTAFGRAIMIYRRPV